MKKPVLSAWIALLGLSLPLTGFGGDMTAKQLYGSPSGQTDIAPGNTGFGAAMPALPVTVSPAQQAAPLPPLPVTPVQPSPAGPVKPPKPDAGSLPANRPPAPAPVPYAGLSFWVNVVTTSGREEVSTVKRVFHSGEKLRLSFRPNQSGYLYVYNRGSSGKTRLLYPAQGDNNLVKAGSVVRIPSRSNDWLRMDDQPGQEEMIVLMTRKPLPNIVPAIPLTMSQVNAGMTQPATDIPTAQFDAALSGTTAKDMLLQHDDKPNDGKPPASYVVAPGSQLENGRVLSVSVKLKHQ